MTNEERDAMLIRMDCAIQQIVKDLESAHGRCHDLRTACVAAQAAKLVDVNSRLDMMLNALTKWKALAMFASGALLGTGVVHASAIRMWLGMAP